MAINRRKTTSSEQARNVADADFRAAVANTRPLIVEPRVPAATARKPPPRARFSAAARKDILRESLEADPEVMDAEVGDSVSFRRSGVPDSVLRKLRRGQYRLEGEIDLHGLTALAARSELQAFLTAALVRRLRCLRIVHGKGLRSGQRGPVLKNLTVALLRRIDAVQAFCSARHVDGGTGAVYVLLTAA